MQPGPDMSGIVEIVRSALIRGGLNAVGIRLLVPLLRHCHPFGGPSSAVRLLDARRSAIRVAEPPPGTFAHPGLAVCAEINEALAVHLPTPSIS